MLRIKWIQMRFPARKGVLLLATVSFMTMATGASLQLHLLTHDHQQEHDSDKCSVCQHFLTTPGKFTQEPKCELPGANLLKRDAEFPLHICITTFHHNPFSPRAPPLA